MADKHKDKRQKVVPPTAPKTHASRSSSVKPGNYARSRSMSDVAREQTPLSGKSALSTRAYPTPELTARKSVPRADSSELSSNRLPPLDLGVVSTPRSASRGITHTGLSDSDNARIVKQAPPKIKWKKSVLPSDSDDSDDSPSAYMKSKAKEDPDEGQGLERDEDQGLEGSDEEGDQSSEEVDEDEDAGPSTTKSGVKASIQKGNKIHAHYTKARRVSRISAHWNFTYQPLVPPQVGIAYVQGGQQGAGVRVAHVGFPLDPNLANPPTQPSQFNAMPPPPEITHSTLAPELPEAEWAPSAKKKNSKHKANEGGKGSKGVKRKGNPKKSRETIEVDDEGEDAGEAIAGPSHLPPNAGHPSKLHLTFKGN